MEELLEIIKKKKETAQTDLNRYLQKPNEYAKDILIIRGELMAYIDLESEIIWRSANDK